MILYTKQNKI